MLALQFLSLQKIKCAYHTNWCIILHCVYSVTYFNYSISYIQCHQYNMFLAIMSVAIAMYKSAATQLMALHQCHAVMHDSTFDSVLYMHRLGTYSQIK